MERAMRRTDRQLSKEEAVKILENGEYGILATVGEEGYPYALPINYVYEEGAIYFHGAANCGRKYDNINYCSKVSFTVVGATEVLPDKFATKYESVIADGVATRLIGEEKRKAFVLLLKKYSSEFMESGFMYLEAAFEKADAYKITVARLTAKARR